MQPLRLLVIEDEVRLLNHISRGLSEENFTVRGVGSAEAAEQAISKEDFDTIVLDLRLPEKDGITFLRELRTAGNSTPVLILTARALIDERVIGLDSGADDYLIKPLDRKSVV